MTVTKPRLPRFAVDDDAVASARRVLARKQVAIFIVAFQAERFIGSVLERIPAALREELSESQNAHLRASSRLVLS